MDHIRKLSFFCVLAIALPFSASAQLDNGPGFDPTPVEIPNIQKTATRPVRNMDLLTLRDFHGLQISPDGKYVVFVLGQAVYETNSYRTGLFVIGTEKGSKPVSLGTAGRPRWGDANQWTPETPQWSPDSKYIYHLLRTSGTWQVWKWSREGGAPVQVTHAQYPVQNYQSSSDNTKLVLTLENLSLIDKKQLAEHGVLYDGSILAGIPQPIVDQIINARSGERETWIHDLRDGSEHKATDKERETYAGDESNPSAQIFEKTFSKTENVEIKGGEIVWSQISPDRKKVIYTRMVDNYSESEWATFALLVKSMDGGLPVTLAAWNYFPGLYWWSPDSKEIYFTEDNEADADDPRPSKLMVVPVTGGKPREVFGFPGFLREYSADHSGRLLACTQDFASGTKPLDLALVEVSTGEIRTLVDANPEFKNLELSIAKRIDFSNKNGDHRWGHLVLPPNYEQGKRYPLIITGYEDDNGFLRGGVGDEYPIHVFAANGFAVLNFEAVGRTRNTIPNDFDRTILLWQSPIEGMEAAVAKLMDMGVIDSSRVGTTGLSYGATLVDYGISHSGLFRAAIDSGAGSYDPLAFYVISNEYRESFSKWQNLESPDGDSLVRWQKLSSALNARRINTPLLINAADSEYIYDMQLVSTLRELKKPVEMFMYPDEGHIKNQPKHRYEIYERNVDWLCFWLKGEEDPDPAKAEQYARWRELRKLQQASETGRRPN